MMKRFEAAFLSLCMGISLLASCGEAAEPSGTDTTTAAGDTTTETAEDAYRYPAVDLGGEEFVILNTAQSYGFYSNLDFEEATGDALDDAVYERNRFVEEKFNFKLVVNEDYVLEKSVEALRTAVLAGDDIYDVAFPRDSTMTSLLSDGMLVDLQDVENFNFDQPWWDTAAYEAVRFGESKNAYYAYTDVSFCDFEGTICVFFNEDMMEDYGLELPYEHVRKGTWTLDKFGEYMQAGANLNGQNDFAWDENGTASYGLMSWGMGYTAMFYGTGFEVIVKDEDNNPMLAAFDDRYISAMQKVIALCSVDGEYLFLDSASVSANSHYEMGMKNGRALMTVSQLKAANKYRDMAYNYGIVPMPKWDEAQEKYHNLRSYSYAMCIPVTNKQVEEAAAIMDALSYYNYTKVMDDFYNGRVSQKSLRNEESIEMLEIIYGSRMLDIGTAYGWSTTIRKVFQNTAKEKSMDIVSALTAQQSAVEADIAAVLESLNG